jgi:hypothetical protein
MIGGAKIYFIVFGILTIAGGVLGYVKAGSMASIIAGSISGVLLFAGSVVDAGTSGRGIDYRTHCFTAAGGAIYSEIFPHLQSDAGGVDVGPERYRDYCRDCGLAEEIIACGSSGLARCAGLFFSFFLRFLSQLRCVGFHWNAGAGR